MSSNGDQDAKANETQQNPIDAEKFSPNETPAEEKHVKFASGDQLVQPKGPSSTPELQPKWAILSLYLMVLATGCFQTGLSIFGNNQVSPVLIAKFGWDVSEARLYNSIIGNAGILGILAGSVTGGPIINLGRRRATFIMDIVVLVGVGISLIFSLPTILLGRFIIGYTGGVFNMICSKSVLEVVN